jgi:hypothetical protein
MPSVERVGKKLLLPLVIVKIFKYFFVRGDGCGETPPKTLLTLRSEASRVEFYRFRPL